jgi:hypothetical protein
MKPIAVVYYSRTGATQIVAQELMRRLSADVYAIQDVHSRHGVFGFLRSVFDALHQREVRIVAPDIAFGRYRAMVIATPVWANNIAAPMRTWLKRHANALPDVAFVCTYGGSGAQSVLKDMVDLAGKPSVADLALRETEVRVRSCGAKLDDFGKAVADAGSVSLGGEMPA